jgi:uncharacterized protein (TIGR00369 family)
MQHALPNFWPGNCFACSPHNPHGLHMQFQKSGEGCHARVSLPAHLCGMEGVAHGGIVATLLDETAAWTLVAHAGRLALTTEMNIRFVKPVPLGRELTAGARILSRDDKRAQTQASVTTPDGTVLAQADASWTLLTAPIAARMTGLDRSEIERYIASIFNY